MATPEPAPPIRPTRFRAGEGGGANERGANGRGVAAGGASPGGGREKSRNLTRPPLPDPLPVPVPDNHCHLDIQYGEDWLEPAVALELSTSVGVDKIVQIGCDLPGAAWAVRTAERFERIVAGVAIHPNEAPRLDDNAGLDEALTEIERLVTSSPGVRAVGETGLDYYRTGPAGVTAQRRSFAAHIEMANRHDKTLVIHDRDAHDDVLAMLDEQGTPSRTVMHCFSGDADVARRCLDRGVYLSFAGTVTFKNAGGLRDALRLAPLDRILVETDAPFLTPMPFRGRPNASYLIPLTVRAMAQARSDDLETLCSSIAANTDAAFGGPWGRPTV
ncbi:MAG: TatD family hydrolase [Propionibacteriales bacterium]|nr:TatD family hydrolase [Propionibacteriales bacterium]